MRRLPAFTRLLYAKGAARALEAELASARQAGFKAWQMLACSNRELENAKKENAKIRKELEEARKALTAAGGQVRIVNADLKQENYELKQNICYLAKTWHATLA